MAAGEGQVDGAGGWRGALSAVQSVCSMKTVMRVNERGILHSRAL